jgi:hypothetical protein
MWDPLESKDDHLTPAKIQYFQLLKLKTQRSTFTVEVLDTAIIITALICNFCTIPAQCINSISTPQRTPKQSFRIAVV